MLILATIYLLGTVPITRADQGDEISNNLFSDLAPLLALFGEQVCKQYLSQSFHWLDHIIFACAPLGILTAVVSAIRIGGGRSLKSLIGRAREPEAVAEMELMSSTSSDVCELWNGVGLVRVAGSPHIVEVMYNTQTAEIYSREESMERVGGAPEYDAEQYRNKGFAPNISLNASGSTHEPNWETKASACAGIVLQAGVLIFDAFITYYSRLSWRKGGKTIPTYAYPLTLLGTLGIVGGLYCCAYVVEASTSETVWQQRWPIQIVWLQKFQIVSDQNFKSYAIFAAPKQARLVTSHPVDNRHARFRKWVILGSALSIIGFILQFVGLRAMHFSATIAQLIATVIMTVLRVAIRRKVTRGPEGHFITDPANSVQQPQTSHVSELPEGRELHHMAKYITKCEKWQVVGLSNESQHHPSLAYSLLEARVALAKISGPSWQNEVNQIASFLSQGIEVMMNNIWGKRGLLSVSGDAAVQGEFFWAMLIAVRAGGQDEEVSLGVSAKRDSDGEHWGNWRVDQDSICGILYLWMSQLQENDVPDLGKSLWLLGPNDYKRMLLSDWWIARDTHSIEFESISSACHEHGIHRDRVFDCFSSNEDPDKDDASSTHGPLDQKKKIGIITTLSLGYTCSQYFLFAFVCQVVKALDNFEARTTAKISPSRHPLLLTNDEVQYLAELVQGASSATTTDDSYRIVMSALVRAGMLQHPLDDHELSGILEVAKSADQGNQQQICKTLRLLCRQRTRNRAAGGRLVEAGSLNIRVRHKVTNAFGPGHPETQKTIDSMRETARLLFRNNTLAYTMHSDPFPLHHAARVGHVEEAYDLIMGSISLLPDGYLETRDDVGHTPLSLAVAYCQVRAVILLLLFDASVNVSDLPEKKSMVHLAVESSQGGIGGGEQQQKTEIVKLLHVSGANISATDQFGRAPLHYVAEHGHDETVRALLDGGVEINAIDIYGESALYMAIHRGHQETARVLLETRSDKSTVFISHGALLILAASKGYNAIVRMLLDKGANKDETDQPGRTALHYAAEQGHDETVQVLLGERVNTNAVDMYGNSAMHLATEGGYETIVELLLRQGADKDAKNLSRQTPLHIAAHKGYDAIVRMLLDARANVEAKDNAGLTALHLALREAHETTFHMLLEAGANPNAKDGKGWVVLHRAARYGNDGIVRVLLDAGADKTEVCKIGWTALHFAVVGQSLTMMQLLLDAGVNRSVKDNAGNTPLALAMAYGDACGVAGLLAEE